MDPKRLNDGLHEVATDVETPPIHEFSVRTSKEWLGLKELTRYADISQRTLRSWIYSAVDPLPAAKVCGKVLSVKRWIAELADRGLARNTIRLAVSTLRAVINAAIEDGLMGFNPAQKLGRLVKAEEPRHPASSLSSKEADRQSRGIVRGTMHFSSPLCEQVFAPASCLPCGGVMFNSAKATVIQTATSLSGTTMTADREDFSRPKARGHAVST